MIRWGGERAGKHESRKARKLKVKRKVRKQDNKNIRRRESRKA